MPTASAVVADVIDCAKHMERKKFFGWQDSEPGYVADYLDNITSFYIRGTTQNAAAAIARINSLFGDVQMLTRANAPEGEFAFATAPLSERELDKKLALIEEAEIASVIRITDY